MTTGKNDIDLDQVCGTCRGTLIIIPEHGNFVQHEDAEIEADHPVTRLRPWTGSERTTCPTSEA